MEVTEHILSIKYGHPFSKIRKPVLEVPLQKIISFKTKKGFINNMLTISINTRRGIINFYYRLGILPKNQNDQFKKMFDFISSINIKNES